MLSGAVGSFAGNPFDVIKIRMMANKDDKVSVILLVKEVWRNQGISGFYSGFQSAVLRSMVMNAVKMASYDTCKLFMQTTFQVEGILLQFLSSFAAGFF